MRVKRRTVALLWRGWWAALALTLGYAAVVAAMPARPAATVASFRLLRPVTATTAPAAPAMRSEAPVPEPIPAALPVIPAPLLDTSVVPARPFSLGRASALDRARALRCLADAVYYEAASEPDAGQRAVAQVILNRVRHPAFPATVCGVVYQGAPARGCQFTFACDGSLARVPSAAGWTRAARVAAAALAGRVEPSVGLATYYHTFAVTPAWNRAMVMTGAIGAHFFHRPAGLWGTPAAFGRVYAGGEPALPLPSVAAPGVAATSVASAVPFLEPVPAAPFLPTAAAPVAAGADDHLPPAAAVLPRWRDSGKPL